MIRVMVVYDISDNKDRRKACETCQDYGLIRHQYSVFTGLLKPIHIRELVKVLRPFTNEGRITVFPISSDDWDKRQEFGEGGISNE